MPATSTRPEDRLREVAALSPFALHRMLGSSPRGLTEAEAAQRHRVHGDNTLDPSTPTGVVERGVTALRSPFVGLLAVLATVFVLVGDLRGGLTVTVMVLISVVLRFWQQTRSEAAVRALRSGMRDTVTVRRRARAELEPLRREVPLVDVVPGDVLVLAPGDVVPADVRVLAAVDLQVDQAVLTGESLPVAKRAEVADDQATTRPEEAPSLCLAGSAVVSGSATAVVVATGASTYSGARTHRPSEREESSFDRGVRSVSWTLVRFMLVMVPIVFVVNGSVTRDWAQAALFAAAVAVGLTPEMLPVIVTTTLARGARRLARHDVIVTRLNAVQDLGAADVVCLDKTGTLTEERLVVTHSIDGAGYPDDSAADHAALAVRCQLAPDGPLDEAILAQVTDLDDGLIHDALYTAVEEVGFDRARRRSTILVGRSDGQRLLITKGDPDDVLPRCDRVRREGRTVALDRGLRFQATDLAQAHARQGLRLLAVAVRPVRPTAGPGGTDESGLVLVGFVGFVDPVRASAAETVARLDEHGVRVLVLTGDNRDVAARVAAQAGVPVGEVALGADVDTASDRRLALMVERVRVFARMTPAHKARVVAALRAAGHAVGFVGDGVNDVAALQIADVGVVAHTAAPAAKRAADLILTDPDLAVLAEGIVEGRRTLGNTLKYVTITASSNFGNVATVLAASVFLPFLPMLPLQLVAQNLLYDAAQLALPVDRVDPEYLRRPRRFDTSGLVGFMLTFGPLSSLFDLGTFAVLWWGVAGGRTPTTFHAGWFVEGLVSQLAVVLVLRTRGSPVARRPTRPVVLAALGAAALGIALVASPAAGLLQFRAPPASALLWLAGVVTAYVTVVQLVKVALRRVLRKP